MFLILFTEEEVRVVVLNNKKKHHRPRPFSVIGNGNDLKKMLFIKKKHKEKLFLMLNTVEL